MNPKTLLAIALLLVPLGGIGVDLYTPSLPAIVHDFAAHPALVKFTIGIYLLGFALGQIIFGTMSDTYGRKNAVLLGLLIFTVASIAAPFTNNIYLLLLIRAIQGLGTASASVIAKALLTDTFKDKQLTFAMSYLSLAWALGPIIAPVIGGYLQFHFNWQANFYFYFLLGCLLLLAVNLFLKETNASKVEFNWSRVKNNYRTLIKHPLFLAGVFSLGIGYSTILVFAIIGPFLIQTKLGFSSIVYGYASLSMGAAYMIGGTITRIMTHFLDAKKVMLLGLTLFLATSLFALVVAYALPLSLALMILPAFLAVVSIGILFPIYMGQALKSFAHMGGTASAGLGAIFIFITFIASSLISMLKAHSLVPMAWAYFELMLLMWVVYFIFIHRFDAKSLSSSKASAQQ